MKSFKEYITEMMDIYAVFEAISDANMFCRGYCPEFAIALHQYTGYPIHVFQELQHDKDEDEDYGVLAHVAVKTPDNRYADARGIRKKEEIVKNLLTSDLKPLKNYRIIPYTQFDLESEQEINPEALELATQYISKHKKLYKL